MVRVIESFVVAMQQHNAYMVQQHNVVMQQMESVRLLKYSI